MPFNHLILCHPLLLPPSIFPSIRVFSKKSVLHIRWPKYWSFSFSIHPSNEYSGLISFRMDWLDLQGTLESLLQHHSSKASILQRSATKRQGWGWCWEWAGTSLLHVTEFSVLHWAALMVGKGQPGCLGKSSKPSSNGPGFRAFRDALGKANVKFMPLGAEPYLLWRKDWLSHTLK